MHDRSRDTLTSNDLSLIVKEEDTGSQASMTTITTRITRRDRREAGVRVEMIFLSLSNLISCHWLLLLRLLPLFSPIVEQKEVE